MWAWLKSLVAWLFGRAPLTELSITQVSPAPPALAPPSLTPPDPRPTSWDRRPPFEPPRDPRSFVRSPRWHGPPGRNTAAAVGEPDDVESLIVIGVPHDRTGSVRGFPCDASDATLAGAEPRLSRLEAW